LKRHVVLSQKISIILKFLDSRKLIAAAAVDS